MELKIFKNRSQDVYNMTAEEFDEYGRFWTRVTGDLIKKDNIDKYPNYDVYEVSVPEVTGSSLRDSPLVVPAKALVVFKLEGKMYNFNLSYETKLLHAPRPLTPDGLVMMSVNETYDPDYSDMKKYMWKQCNFGDIAILLKLMLYTKYDPTVNKDDVTGEWYAYILNKIIVLRIRQ